MPFDPGRSLSKGDRSGPRNHSSRRGSHFKFPSGRLLPQMPHCHFVVCHGDVGPFGSKPSRVEVVPTEAPRGETSSGCWREAIIEAALEAPGDGCGERGMVPVPRCEANCIGQSAQVGLSSSRGTSSLPDPSKELLTPSHLTPLPLPRISSRTSRQISRNLALNQSNLEYGGLR